MPNLKVEGVSKRYANGKQALVDVSFDVDAGTMLAVVGHNGAGKSTLLNIVSGLIKPTTGSVSTDPPGQRLMWAPQRTTVDWSLTVVQNIELVARLTGTPLSRVEAILSLLDLQQVRNQQAEYISGGQLQRVQIGRALVTEAPIMVLDEPAAGLDPKASDLVMSYLQDRATEGHIVLVSSHDLDAVERAASDLLLIDTGCVRAHMTIARFVQEAGAMTTVRVSLANLLSDQVLSELQDTLPTEWVLQTGSTSQTPLLVVRTPVATGLGQILGWLPRGLSIVDLTVERESLRDVYLAKYATSAVAETESLA